MRRLGAILLVAATLLLSPGTAGAQVPQDRLNRIAAGLAKDPVFLDPDLLGVLTTARLTEITKDVRTTAAAVGQPVYLVVIPNPTDSESQGKPDVLLWGIHEHVGKDGLYLTVDDAGYLAALAYRLPRDVEDVPWKLEAPSDVHHGFADVPARLAAYLAGVRSAPAAEPAVPIAPYTEPDDISTATTGHHGWDWGEFTGGFVVIGPIGAFLVFGLGLAGLRVGRRIGRVGRGPAVRQADLTKAAPLTGAPARPKARWARHAAADEVARLGRELDEQPKNPGRSYALTAYDAAQLLLAESELLDLVGVIVLARQGRAALARGTADPGPPCFVNPLHGPGTVRKAVQLPDLRRSTRKRPVCAACANKPGEVLRDAEGRPHYTVPGIWQDTGFGALVPALAPRVLEHLGVD